MIKELEETKVIRVNVKDYNTMTLIARQNGFVDPRTDKMIPAMVVEHLIKNFADKIA